MANTVDSMLGFLADSSMFLEEENGWVHYKFPNGLDLAYKSFGDVYVNGTNTYALSKQIRIFSKNGLTLPKMKDIYLIKPFNKDGKYYLSGLTGTQLNDSEFYISCEVIGAQGYDSIYAYGLKCVAIGTWK